MTIQELRNTLEQQKGKQSQIKSEVSSLKEDIQNHGRIIRLHEKARGIVKEVGLKTQEQLQFHIADITSLALESVFPNPYKLVAEFVQRRNKTECDLLFERDDNRIDPLSASGGGVVDVASFALRIASWSMAYPKSSAVIILDEPMRFLSAEYQEKASAMIKEVSQKLGIQFIIITHEPVLATMADRVFETHINKGVTKVK